MCRANFRYCQFESQYNNVPGQYYLHLVELPYLQVLIARGWSRISTTYPGTDCYEIHLQPQVLTCTIIRSMVHVRLPLQYRYMYLLGGGGVMYGNVLHVHVHGSMELKDSGHHTQVHVHVATTSNTNFSITCRKMMCQGTAVNVESRRTCN
eukprot:SAG11_NODE_13404_length_655_cov_10.538600_1_plen_150_part_10